MCTSCTYSYISDHRKLLCQNPQQNYNYKEVQKHLPNIFGGYLRITLQSTFKYICVLKCKTSISSLNALIQLNMNQALGKAGISGDFEFVPQHVMLSTI